MDCSELIEGVKKKVRHICEKNGIELEVKCPGHVSCQADYDKMHRVLLNLLNNAIESYEYKNIKNPRVTISLTRDNGNIIIIFADNGPGIPKQIADNIFTPFTTFGKSGGPGWGWR